MKPPKNNLHLDKRSIGGVTMSTPSSRVRSRPSFRYARAIRPPEAFGSSELSPAISAACGTRSRLPVGVNRSVPYRQAHLSAMPKKVNKWLSLGHDPSGPMGAFMTGTIVGMVSVAILALISGAFLAIPFSHNPAVPPRK